MIGIEVVFVLGLTAASLAVPTFPETTDSDECPTTQSIKSFPHPTDCSKYYQCENGTKVEMNCYNGTYYNRALKVCDLPRYSGCNISGSTPINSTQAPINETETKNDTRSSISKEWFIPKFLQKISDRNDTSIPNDTEVVRNGHAGLETNGPEASRNKNTLTHILADSNWRNNNNSSSNATKSTTNSSSITKSSPGSTTEKIISSRNVTKSLNESSETTNPSNNATTTIKEEQTTENSSEDRTEASAGKTTLQKVNVTNGKEIKIAEKKDENETESEEADNNDDEDEPEEVDDKKENEKRSKRQ